MTDPGQKYTLSFWVKSENAGNIVFRFNNCPTSTDWQKYVVQFTPEEDYILLSFSMEGTYYIYHPQLEIGDKATDWVAAPEDTEDKIDSTVSDLNNNINNQISTIHESIADLVIGTSEVEATVKEIISSVDDISGKVISAQEKISSLELSSAEMNLQFKDITNNGVTKVTTETGFTFDREGMTVDSTDSPTKTQVTPDGMTVYKKDASGAKEEVLEATSEGVDATNLHAKTYLIVGGRSRFENYGTDRTGCFWIGG